MVSMQIFLEGLLLFCLVTIKEEINKNTQKQVGGQKLKYAYERYQECIHVLKGTASVVVVLLKS